MHPSIVANYVDRLREWADMWEQDATFDEPPRRSEVAMHLRRAAAAMNLSIGKEEIDPGLQAYPEPTVVTEVKSD